MSSTILQWKFASLILFWTFIKAVYVHKTKITSSFALKLVTKPFWNEFFHVSWSKQSFEASNSTEMFDEVCKHRPSELHVTVDMEAPETL